MNEGSCKRENTSEAIVSRDLIRDRFEFSGAEDEMLLLIEVWEPEDFPGVDFYVQYKPVLAAGEEGGYFLDHGFFLAGKGNSGRLPSNGIRIPGDPESALRAGESLVAYAFTHEEIRLAVRNACPELVAEFDRKLLDLQAGPGVGGRKPKI